MKRFGVALLVGMTAVQFAFAQEQPAPVRQVSEPTVSPGEQALRFYAALTHRTILRPSMLPRLPDALPQQMMADTNAAAALFEKALAEKRIELVRDGELFVRLLPEGWQTSALAAQLLRISSPPKREPSGTAGAATAGSLPAGTIDFRNPDIDAVLAIYGDLCNRTVLRPSHLPQAGIVLRTETTLSREEAVYAMNVVLALNGIAAVEDGLNFVQVVPMRERELVKTLAPKPKLTDPLIKPEEVPVFVNRPPLFYPPRPPAHGPTTNHLAPPPGPAPQPGVDELVAYYAGLLGQKGSSSTYQKQKVSFKAQNALTKTELLYAIETTLALDGLKIERQEDGTLQAAPK